eukprot:scaffold24998_cov129-Isochrysis_galbana.AAC.4
MVASIMGAPTSRPTTWSNAGCSAMARHDGTKMCADFSGGRCLIPSCCQLLRSCSQSAMHASEWVASARVRSTGPTTPPLPSADHARVGGIAGLASEGIAQATKTACWIDT